MAKILVIEDEAPLREEILEWLTLEDHEAQGASNGLEGLEIARSQTFDLIISDINMPGLDGFGVLLELNSDPMTMGTPFIFITARAALEDMRHGMNLGADDYVIKPFTSAELLRAIEIRLQKKALQVQQFQTELEKLQNAFEEEHHQRLIKAKMVGMFSHDFRNPLAAILSSLDMVRTYDERLSPERKQQHFNKMEQLVKRLMQMLDDMLLIAQMDAEYLTCTPQEINLSDFVEEIIDEFRHIHVNSHEIDFSSTLKGTYGVDPKLFRQIVSNLISNAIKYSPRGSEVKISLRLEAQNIVLEIQDEGIGIPSHDVATLFEPFQRASNVNKKEGTGLGLAIVKLAVELHNGFVTVKSQVNEGSIFQVTIPNPQPELHNTRSC